MVARQFQKFQEMCRSLNSWTNEGSGLEDVVALAAGFFDSPFALITITDANNEHYFYNKLKNDVQREAVQSFCLNLSAEQPLIIVEDTLKDRMAIKNKFVHGRPYIRFFAAIMLKTKEGHDLGCLSIADDKPKTLSQEQINILQLLARWIFQIVGYELDIRSFNDQLLQARNNAAKELITQLQNIICSPSTF